MGGKISTKLPENPASAGFGSAEGSKDSLQALGNSETTIEDNSAASQTATNSEKPKSSLRSAAETLGVKPSKEREQRERAAMGRRRLFKPDAGFKTEPLDKSGLIQGTPREKTRRELHAEQIEKSRGRDALSAIEERLKIRGR